jgi:aminoglycoside 6-adenylyltransferase
MRTSDEIMECILSTAKSDPSILAVGLQGSRSKQIDVDRYSDFDIVYIVRSLKLFLDDKQWINRFGDILILQTPDDWFDAPFDARIQQKFTWLMQFSDLSRIDLTLIESDDPSMASLKMSVILDKEGIFTDKNIEPEAYPFRLPSEKEFLDTVNEFWWITFYVAKGLCRNETPYAYAGFEILLRMTGRMLEWKTGMQHPVGLGKWMRHLRDFLPSETYVAYEDCFPTLRREDIAVKLDHIMTFFPALSQSVAKSAEFDPQSENTGKIRETILDMIATTQSKSDT